MILTDRTLEVALQRTTHSVQLLDATGKRLREILAGDCLALLASGNYEARGSKRRVLSMHAIERSPLNPKAFVNPWKARFEFCWRTTQAGVLPWWENQETAAT
jgi:hypothetical protein